MKKAFLAIGLGTVLVLVFGLWAWEAWHDPLGNPLAADAAGRMLAGGRLAGLVAALAILWQLVLLSRAPWIEPLFGLDRLARWHHAGGFIIPVALAAHAGLVTFGHALYAEVGAWEQYQGFWTSYKGVAAAMVGTTLAMLLVAASLAPIRRWLGYEGWYRCHLLLYLAAALAFWHQLAVGSDLAGDEPPKRLFAGLWIVLNLAVAGNLLLFRVARPLWRSWVHRFRVARLVPEADGVTSVYLEGRHLERFQARGGQFVIVRFLAPGFWSEAHPFSLSLPPDGRGLRLTIRAVGDYTRRIPALPLGTSVIVDGPAGVFTAAQCQAPKALLIAGGIGITPMRAMLDDLLAAGREVVLVYANRQRSAIAFEQELQEVAARHPGQFRIVHVLNDNPEGFGETGVVDGQRLGQWVPDVAEREVFLCGPPPMTAALRKALANLGVPNSRLHDERFAL